MSAIKMHITLIGENFDPTYITNRLNMTPDRFRVKEELLRNGREFGHYEWGICSSNHETEFASEVIDEILERISDKLPLLAAIAKEVNAGWEILFTIDVYGDFPVIVFSENFIQMAATLESKIGFDVLLLN